MGNVTYRWRRGYARELRTLPAAKAMVAEAAAAVGAAAGPDYTVTPVKETGGRGRARAAVVAETIAARRDQAKNGSLQRALGSVRI
ncbi:MAG: hypothetical protein LBE08_10390 [Bifidobacteriaceae bacterium]|jgi:hypothetical protein|nr:hypothetical protein [Bifidobacteriaceae bacterium]